MNDAASFALFYFTGLIAASVVHECGHLAMGVLVRGDPRVICIGVGPKLGRMQCAGIWLVLRFLPIGGYVLLLPRSRERRTASFFISAAGPLANLLAAAVLWLSFDLLPDTFAFAWLSAQTILLAVSLVPYTAKINGFPVFTDGKKMLLFVLGRDRDVVADAYARVAKALSPDTEPPKRTKSFPEIVLQATRSDRKENWGRRQAIDALSAVSAAGTLNKMEAEFAKQLIYEYVDAEQVRFRSERYPGGESQRYTWRRLAAAVRGNWLRLVGR